MKKKYKIFKVCFGKCTKTIDIYEGDEIVLTLTTDLPEDVFEMVKTSFFEHKIIYKKELKSFEMFYTKNDEEKGDNIFYLRYDAINDCLKLWNQVDINLVAEFPKSFFEDCMYKWLNEVRNIYLYFNRETKKFDYIKDAGHYYVKNDYING